MADRAGNPRILIIDDDESSRQSLELILRKKGFETTQAATGKDALKQAHSASYNVALIDIKLPDMSGIELIEALKKIHPDIELCMITGFASLENTVAALNLGASAYILKPLNMEEVLATLDRMLDKQRLVIENRRLLGEVQRELTERKKVEQARARLNTQLEAYAENLEKEIGERRQAEEELRQYEKIVSSSTDMLALLDTQFRYLAANEAYWTAFNLDSKGLIGHTAPDVFGEQAFNIMIKPHAERCLAGEEVNFQEWVDFPGHGRRLMEVNYYPFVGDDNEIKGFAVNGRDITERKQFEDELRLVNQKLQTSIDQMPTAYIVWDMDLMIAEWNQAASRIFGYSREEIVGQLGIDYIVPEHAREIVAKVLANLKQGEVVDYSEKDNNIRKDGSLISCRWYNTPLVGTDGQIFAILSIVDDITERRQAEEKLKDSEERYRSLVETSQDLIWSVDENGCFSYLNPAWEKLLGYSSEEMLGQPFAQFKPPEIAERDVETFKNIIGGSDTFGYETIYLTKNGAEKHLIFNAQKIKSSTGMLLGTSGTAHDFTERKLAEQARERLNALLEAKNQELEQIVHVAFHDLRSPLVNIDGYGKELQRAINDLRGAFDSDNPPTAKLAAVSALLSDDIPNALQYIRTSTSKMDALLSGMLKLSRSGRAVLTINSLDMNDLMAKVVDACDFQIKESGTDLIVAELPPCRGDTVQVNQVFSNLLGNALQFLDSKRAGTVKISGQIRDNQSVYCVEDNGIGIDPIHQQKIFEVFHQLDPAKSEGDGLGLTIVQQILGRLSGEVWLESTLGEGSRFYVALPVG